MRVETTLNFDNVDIIGKDNEISCLEEAFERVKGGKGQESIFLRGESGSGKSTLLKIMQENCNTPFFVQGKFDAVSNHPMSAIREALSTLCIQAADSDNRNRISEKLRESLGNNCSLLLNSLPECRRLLGEEISANYTREGNNVLSTDYLYRSVRFLIESCQHEEDSVVVMCIDDMQWADVQSWNHILVFLHDFKVPRFLFVGTYRIGDLSPEREENIQHYARENKIQLIDLHI
jgi:predicted ATPase